jgi:hypothetical protein
MPLHRDIFWIGRQWAVTGFGMQAINQKHGGEFDIPIERLWDDDLPNTACAQKWFNPDDFNKGLAVARARYPQSLATPAPAKPVAPKPVERPQASTPTAPPPPPAAPPIIAPVVDVSPVVPAKAASAPVKSEKSSPPPLRMSLFGHPAKLLKVWRARRRRQ